MNRFAAWASPTFSVHWLLGRLVSPGLLGSLVGLSFLLVSLYAQETPTDRLRMATNQLKQVASEISARSLTDVTSREDWERRRPEMKKRMLEMLGLGSLPPRGPLRATTTGILQRERYSIEKVVFQSSPGLYVTGNFYLPHATSAKDRPAPVILYLCGHAPHPLGAKFNYQDRAAWFAAHGFACLILDTLEFGEVPGIHHGLHDLNMWRWLSLGYTPAGTEVWNAMRAIDYLETRPEVDVKRLGVTGISGGGATTWYLAAVDERVQAAAPVCSTYTFGSQARNWRAAGQCDCIYFHNTYRQDFPLVAALIAPRPLLMISGRKDGDFPPDGYHEVFQRSKRVFELYGAADRVSEFDDEVGHSDPPQFLRAARQWMQRWLREDLTPLPMETNAAPRETAEDLACLKEWPRDAINDQIHDQLTQPVRVMTLKSRADWAKRKTALRATLDEKVFGFFPKESIPFETRVSRNEGGWAARYANYKDVSFQIEPGEPGKPGARVRAQLLTPKAGATGKPLLIYVKRPGDSIYFLDLDELLPVLGRHSVLILNPRFSEGSIPADQYRDIQMTAAWCGRTIAAMQIWDVLRAVEWVLSEEKLSPSEISVFGKGETGIVALYAALRDARITRVILSEPPASHWEGPALLNILRISDLNEMAGTLAPRELVSLTPWPGSFDVTREIYRMERATAQLRQAGSLAGALEMR